jgi:hypothetical protein
LNVPRKKTEFHLFFIIYLYTIINHKEATKEFVFPKVERLLHFSLRQKLLISGTLFFNYDYFNVTKKRLKFTDSLIYIFTLIFNHKEATKEFVFPKVERLLHFSLRQKLLILGT